MIGELLKNVRKSKNLTQQVFAKRIGTSPGFISEVENGVKMPGYDLLLSLKREFPDTDMNWLLTGEGQAPEKPTLTPRSAALVSNFEVMNEEDKRAIERLALTVAQYQKITGKVG